jgi:hypothetical protein
MHKVQIFIFKIILNPFLNLYYMRNFGHLLRLSKIKRNINRYFIGYNLLGINVSIYQ